MMFAALTINETAHNKRAMAIRGTLTATIILIVFALIGDRLLAVLGISLAAMRAAGGILLLFIGIEATISQSPG